MKTMLDFNVFTQIGLDSSAITLLGTVVHRFAEPGSYRGTVRSGGLPEATFYVSVDPTCAVAELRVDLAKLAGDGSTKESCCAGEAPALHFVVHPRGYAVFHVSSGSGGYSVNVRRADENPEVKAYDTRILQPDDIFAGVLLRPGTYSIRNLLTDASAEAVVVVPVTGRAAYRPPPPVTIEVGRTIEPRQVPLQPAQGFSMQVKEQAHIRIELVKPDDGPPDRVPTGRAGFRRRRLPADAD